MLYNVWMFLLAKIIITLWLSTVMEVILKKLLRKMGLWKKRIAVESSMVFLKGCYIWIKKI